MNYFKMSDNLTRCRNLYNEIEKVTSKLELISLHQSNIENWKNSNKDIISKLAFRLNHEMVTRVSDIKKEACSRKEIYSSDIFMPLEVASFFLEKEKKYYEEQWDKLSKELDIELEKGALL